MLPVSSTKHPYDSEKSTHSLSAVLHWQGELTRQLEVVQVVGSDIFQNIAAVLACNRGNEHDQVGLGTLRMSWVALCKLGRFPEEKLSQELTPSKLLRFLAN